MDKREVKIFLADIETNVPFQNNKKVDSKKSILHIFKNNILELMLTLSIQGIPNIFRSKYKIMKLIWFFCTMIGIAYTIYNILLSIFDYLQYEVNTSYRVVNEIPIEFPVITICDRNTFKSKFAFEYLTSDVFKKNKTFESLSESEISSIREPQRYSLELKNNWAIQLRTC